jgi:hypothetical protein
MVTDNPAVGFFAGHPDGQGVAAAPGSRARGGRRSSTPPPNAWMHHLELRSPSEVDDEVRAWLVEAYDAAR